MLQALANTGEGYPSAIVSHPAVMMWRGHERALGRYIGAVCVEYASRGYHDKVEMQVVCLVNDYFADGKHEEPEWFGLNAFHENHRARLFEKDPAYYRKEGFGDACPQPGNLWPVSRHGAWIYMIEGKVVARMIEKPKYRMASEYMKQCMFCNRWWNGGDLTPTDQRCPHCETQRENIALYYELIAEGEKQLANELLHNISVVLNLMKTGRL